MTDTDTQPSEAAMQTAKKIDTHHVRLGVGFNTQVARLIAADKKELVEVLGNLLAAEWMVTHDWGGDRPDVIQKAESALARHQPGGGSCVNPVVMSGFNRALVRHQQGDAS